MAIRRIAGAGKVIQDGKLMPDTGFNIEKIKKAQEKDRNN